MIFRQSFYSLVFVAVLCSWLVLPLFADIVTHQYDNLNRLIRTEYSECDSIEYAYDPAGNRTMQVVQTCPKLVISGYILDSEGSGVINIVLTGLPGNPTTDFTGYYSIGVEFGWLGTVIPQKAGYTFTPAERSYENLKADELNQDYTGIKNTVPPDPTETPVNPIPEPTVFILFVTGLLGLLGLWRWKRRNFK